MEKQKVLIVGAGNGGVCSAAHMAAYGHDVSIINRNPGPLTEIQSAGSIELIYKSDQVENLFRAGTLGLDKSVFEGHPVNGELYEKIGVDNLVSLECPIQKAVSFEDEELEEVVREADLVRIITVSTGHRDVARKLAPFLGQDKKQYVLLEPGRTFGAVEFYNTLRDTAVEEDRLEKIVLGEAGTFIFAARKYAPRRGYVLKAKDSLTVAAMPATKDRESPNGNTTDLVRYLKEFYPQTMHSPTGNVLYTSFDNVGTIFHAVLMTLWSGVIEMQHKDQIFAHVQHYSDVTDNMGRVLEAADRERVKVAESFGVYVDSARKWLQRTYGVAGTTLAESMRNNPAYAGLSVPDTLNHRYLFEDARTSALPISELASIADLETPRLSYTVDIASDLLQKDLRSDGRTLDRMGINGMKVDDIVNLVNYGG